MGRSQQTFNKKEREKKRRKKKQEKIERREQRKIEREQSGKKTFEEQLSYIDEYGNISSTPPDPSKKKKIKAEDIVLGVPPKDDTPMEIERKGKVKFFNHEKSFGFIIDSETNESLFVHINDTEDTIQENDRVNFEIENSPRGLKAVKVRLMKEGE
jgi:cold shock CspA family protein